MFKAARSRYWLHFMETYPPATTTKSDITQPQNHEPSWFLPDAPFAIRLKYLSHRQLMRLADLYRPRTWFGLSLISLLSQPTECQK